MLSVGIGINDVFHRTVSTLTDLVEEVAGAERAIRGIDYHHSRCRNDKSSGTSSTKLRISVLVEDVLRHPDKYVGLYFADLVERRRRGLSKLEGKAKLKNHHQQADRAQRRRRHTPKSRR